MLPAPTSLVFMAVRQPIVVEAFAPCWQIRHKATRGPKSKPRELARGIKLGTGFNFRLSELEIFRATCASHGSLRVRLLVAHFGLLQQSLGHPSCNAANETHRFTVNVLYEYLLSRRNEL